MIPRDLRPSAKALIESYQAALEHVMPMLRTGEREEGLTLLRIIAEGVQYLQHLDLSYDDDADETATPHLSQEEKAMVESFVASTTSEAPPLRLSPQSLDVLNHVARKYGQRPVEWGICCPVSDLGDGMADILLHESWAWSEGRCDAVSLNDQDVIPRLQRIPGCVGMVHLHVHPSGEAMPSEKDQWRMKKFTEALNRVGYSLVDALVIAPHRYGTYGVSLREQGMLPENYIQGSPQTIQEAMPQGEPPLLTNWDLREAEYQRLWKAYPGNCPPWERR
jgi:hypothetical protein